MKISCFMTGLILYCKRHSDSYKRTSETDIIKMLEFFIDNIVVVYLCSFLPVLFLRSYGSSLEKQKDSSVVL